MLQFNEHRPRSEIAWSAHPPIGDHYPLRLVANGSFRSIGFVVPAVSPKFMSEKVRGRLWLYFSLAHDLAYPTPKQVIEHRIGDQGRDNQGPLKYCRAGEVVGEQQQVADPGGNQHRDRDDAAEEIVAAMQRPAQQYQRQGEIDRREHPTGFRIQAWHYGCNHRASRK